MNINYDNYDNKCATLASDEPHPFQEQEPCFVAFGVQESFPRDAKRDFPSGLAFHDEKSFDSCSLLAHDDFRSCFDPEINENLRDLSVFKASSTNEKSHSSLADSWLAPTGNKVSVTGKPEQTEASPQKARNESGIKAVHNLLSYIEDAVDNGIKGSSLTAGRPKQEFDTSSERLLKFYNDYVSQLQYLIETNFNKKRSDTFRNTIFSYLKKLPIKLREICCSVSEPKSKKLEVYLDAFLTPFITCFLPYVPTDTTGFSKVELFLYFICICYPEEKVKRIINLCIQQNSLSKDKGEQILKSLSLRKGKSKKEMLIFINSNPCFGMYSEHICRQLKCHNFDEQATLMIKDFL